MQEVTEFSREAQRERSRARRRQRSSRRLGSRRNGIHRMQCMMATMLALVTPGDEVVIFQPFYENYGPDALLSGAKPVWVRLHEPDWHIDFDELRRAFSPRTRAIILNTPNNPTGKVFTRTE